MKIKKITSLYSEEQLTQYLERIGWTEARPSATLEDLCGALKLWLLCTHELTLKRLMKSINFDHQDASAAASLMLGPIQQQLHRLRAQCRRHRSVRGCIKPSISQPALHSRRRTLDLMLSWLLPDTPPRQVLFDRLVTKRGGFFCFGQNLLFREMLRAVGFRCYSGIARVNPNYVRSDIYDVSNDNDRFPDRCHCTGADSKSLCRASCRMVP